MAFAISYGNSQIITGKVIDKKTKEPLISATVKVVETGVATVTDKDGVFKIKADKNQHLVIGFLSYKTITVPVEKAEKVALESDYVGLDEIIVESDPLDDISHSWVITDNIKKGSQPRNVADLFNDIPGFSLQKRSNTSLEPSFRSFKYEEMNIKYNGGEKLVHACPNRMDPVTSHVIPEEVSKIEIVKGPYTVRYGQRFGATVNMVTRGTGAPVLGFHGNIQGGYESNGNNLVGRAQLLYASKTFDIVLNAENRDFGNYKDGNGDIVPASFKTQSYSVKTGVKPLKNHTIHVDFRQKFGKDILHAGLPMDSPKDNSSLLSFDYGINDISEKLSSIILKSYYSYVDHLMDNSLRPNFGTLYARTPVTSNTYGGKLEMKLNALDDFELFCGVDADIIKRDGKKFVTVKKNPKGEILDTPIEKEFSVWQDATIQDLGVYTEGNYRFSDFLSLNTGIRMDFVSSKINDPDPGFEKLYGGEINSVDEHIIGGNISLKHFKNNLQLQVAYGRGVRTASMVERYIYRFTIGQDSRQYIGNPYLKPEKNDQVELSVAKYFKSFSMGSSVFYSLMDDYITAKVNPDFSAPGSPPEQAPKQFVNVDAYQYGFDAFLKYHIFSGLQVSGDIAYTFAQNKTFDEPLAQVAPLLAHIGLKWEKSKYWINFRTRISAKQNRYSPSFNETETPGYTIFDFRAGVKPLKNLSIGVAVMNITDKAYYNHLNFSYKNSDENAGKIFEPGRSFSTYVKYKF